jgi:hypothetical protein
MTTLSQLAANVFNRLEEANQPVFWNATNEVYPMIVEALSEAAVITGEPEVLITPAYTITPGQTWQAMPSNLIAVSRIEGPVGAIRKTSVKDLDFLQGKGWENDTDVSLGAQGVLRFWFPIGLDQFGVYPVLETPVNVVIMGVGLPVAECRPYTGNETVQFQAEYNEAFVRYAASVLRLKEGGPDFTQGLEDYNYFLTKMGELSGFGMRKNLMRFTRAVGHQAEVTRQEKD